MTEYNLGHVVGEKGPKGDTGPQGPQGPKGDSGSDATATLLTDTVTQGDTTHAATGNAVYTAIQQIRNEIGEAIQYNGIVEQPRYLI